MSTIGTTHGVASDVLSMKEITSILTNNNIFGGESTSKSTAPTTNHQIIHVDIPTDVYGSFGFPGAADVANMYRYQEEFENEYIALRSLDAVREQIGGPTLSFEEWVVENKDAF